MTQVEIENRLLYEFKGLSLEKMEEALDFVLFLKQRANLRQENLGKRQRPLGLLDGKVKCRIHKDFAITDEEFLQS